MKCIYVLEGEVLHGKGLGKTVGMPTANVDYGKEVPPLKFGVYATIITVRGVKYVAITNVGRRPSVDNDDLITVEAHILDFDFDIYNEIVKLEFFDYIRDVKKFNSLAEVKKQVDEDGIKARALLEKFI